MEFGYLWVILFLYDLKTFVLMASVSTYYFNSSPESSGEAQVLLAMKWAHITHVGSIALGSGIHTLISILNSSNRNDSDE